jgi:three-Cys-motif partner protein
MPRKKDRWPELCKLVESDDGLPVREQAGTWTERKLIFWNRYIDITTTAMVGHHHWPEGLVYVDLFAGPGVCVLGQSKRRIPGSCLIAAHAPKPFRRIIACELDPESADACETRLKSSGTRSDYRVLTGNCNRLIGDVVAAIPKGALTVAFIDPPGLDANFETIRGLSTAGRVDLLILFADAVDAIRNEQRYRAQTESRLDLVLGPRSNWRSRLDELINPDGTKKRRALAELYKEQLSNLGYIRFGEETMATGRGPLYRLVYASKHERGLDFWHKVTRKDPGGQRRLDLDD